METVIHVQGVGRQVEELKKRRKLPFRGKGFGDEVTEKKHNFQRFGFWV